MLVFYLSLFESDVDKQTFSDFYERVNLKCLHIAISITKDKALAEDAIHNAFMKVIAKKENFFSIPRNEQEKIIVTIVKHKAIDIMRPYKKLAEEIDDKYTASDLDLAEDFESAESYEKLKGFIKSLPDKYKVVFELKYIQDLNNGEIAELLDISKDVVATRLKRAKIKLADMIRESSDSYGR